MHLRRMHYIPKRSVYDKIKNYLGQQRTKN